MQICPVNREWIHNHLMEPYLQGYELVNRAWKGVDRSLAPNHLSLTDRVICWLQGTCLMLPFVNTIIWLSWQAFGTPEKLFDPYCPETEPPPPPPPQVIIHGAIPPGEPILPLADLGDLVRPTELFGFNETTENSALQTNWKIEHFADMIVAQQNCNLFSSTSLYRPDLSLREYHYQMGTKQFDMSQTEGDRNRIHVRFTNAGIEPIAKTFELPKHLPIIQQRAIGFRPFILSADREIHFYAVVPEIPIIRHIPFIEKPPFLMEAMAKKIGEEDVPGYGRLIKIEVASTWRWPYNSVKSELWFDPATGDLKKFVDTGTFINRKVGEFVQNNQLPV